jgi:hypothetical protein
MAATFMHQSTRRFQGKKQESRRPVHPWREQKRKTGEGEGKGEVDYGREGRQEALHK